MLTEPQLSPPFFAASGIAHLRLTLLLKVISVALLLVFTTAVCDELTAPTSASKSPVRVGSCWYEGESFTQVKDGNGATHKVEPFQMRYLEGGADVWLCGVVRTDVIPVEDPDSSYRMWLYMPSGDPVDVVGLPKYWQLFGAQWIYD